MTNDNLRDCCQTPESAVHASHCPIITGPHARSHTAHSRGGTYTVYCMCGTDFISDDERDARAAHIRHAVDWANSAPEPIGPAASPPADIYDATTPPGVTQLPAVTTSMTPAQFKEWLATDGTLFMVILPANRTFVIKVPTAHHEFFVAMMQQVRFALGPEVQAVRMNMVTAPGADVDAATGKVDDAPQWAQPAPGEHLPESLTREARYEPAPPEKHEYIARPAAEQEKPPPCWEQRTPGTLCTFHEGRRAGRDDCWNLRDNNGEHLDDGLTTRCPHGGTCPSDCSRTPDGCQNVERCAHGVRMGIGGYCADCDTSPVKYGPGAAK